MALNLKSTRLTPAQLAKKEKERKLLEQAAQKTAERRTAIKTGDDIALKKVNSVPSQVKRGLGSLATGVVAGVPKMLGNTQVNDVKYQYPLLSAEKRQSIENELRSQNTKDIQGIRNAGTKLFNLQGTRGEDVAFGLGEAIAPTLVPGGLVGKAGKTVFATDGLSKLGTLAARGRQGAAIGLGYTGMAEESPDAEDYTKNAALFGAFDVGAAGIGMAGKNLLGKLAKPKVEVKSENPKIDEVEEVDDFFDLEGAQGIDFTADQFGNVRRGESLPELPAGRQLLALPEGNRPLALTGKQPLMLPEGKIPNWEYWKDRSTPTGNPPIELGPNFHVDQYGNIRTSPETPLALPAGKGEAFVKNTDDAFVPRSDIGDPQYLASLEQRYNKMVADEVKNLKDNSKLGVEQPGLGFSDEGEVVNRWGRMSNNPEWYRKIFAENATEASPLGKEPRSGQYRDQALKNLIEGNAETGEPASEEFHAILSELARGQKLPEEWHGLQNSIRELENAQKTDVAMADPDGITPLLSDMKAAQKQVEPYGLNKNLDRLTELENQARQRMKDRADFRRQYPDAIGIVAKNPLDDIKDLTIIGATKIAKGSIEFAQWSKEMIEEFGQIIEKQLPGIWKHANILNDTGETVLKYKGQEMPVKWQGARGAQTSDNVTAKGISQAEVKKPSAGELKANAVKSIPDDEIERGFSRNTRTDANNPDSLRDSFTENPLAYEQLANKETLGKAQIIFDLGHEPARSELNKLLDEMKPEAIPLAKLLSRQASEAGNMEAAREIIANTAEKLTQAGQFGQAARILREADPETFMLTMEKQLKSLNKEGSNVYGKKWKDIDLTPDELELVRNIKRGDQQSYEEVFEQIHKRIANDLPATVMEKVNAWRHISMLLNPKTQVRNVVGNGIMMGMRQGAKQISAALQNVILPAEKRTQVWKVGQEYKEIAATYFEANKKDLLSGANKYNEGIKLNMPGKRVFKNDALESSRQFTYNLLEKGDTPFYKRAYINRLASFAQARGIKNLADLPQEAFDTAKLEAEQATYKDASELASYLNRVKHPGANANLGQKSVAVIAEAALPFTKTPINIVKRGIQYSPAGIINGISKWGKESAAAGIDEMAKGLTGTGVLGLGYLLAQKEILTGKPAEDADLKNYNASSGNAPFSILGKYTYDWAMPFAVPLSIGVELYNAVKDTKDEAKLKHVVSGGNTDKLAEIAQLSSDIIYNSLAAAGDTTFNMSLMKSIKNLFSNPKGFTAGLAQLPQNYISQFIPTILGQTAGMIDPTVRKSYEKGNIPASILANIETKTPGLSFLAEPKQTPFGEDMKRVQNPLGRLAAQYVSPGNISVDQNIDPQINEEINRLGKLGFKNHIPTVVPNYIEKTSKYPKLELTADETTQYQKRTGELTLSGMKELIDSNEYKFKEDEEQAEMLAKVIKEAKAQAKAEIVEAKGYEPTGTGKKQSGSGLMLSKNR